MYTPPTEYKSTSINFGNINVNVIARKRWTIDMKIYILDVSWSPENAIAVFLCYFFIK